jgi:hypothetical protein
MRRPCFPCNRYGVGLLCIEPTYDTEAIRGAAATHPTISSLLYSLEQVVNIVCPYMQTRDGGDLAGDNAVVASF